MPRSNITKISGSLLVLIAITVACINTPYTPQPVQDIPNGQQVLVNVSASQGGQLALSDNTVLNIPAGALQDDTQVTLSKETDLNSPPSATEMTGVGGVYLINLGTASLQIPATLEIPYDPALLPEGTDPGQVFLSYFDEATQQWVYAGGLVDTTRNVVVLEINHASWWKPTTWNWGSWIAVLDKVLGGNIVDWVEAAQLFTADCSQAGQYVQVDSSLARNLVQGCVEFDDSQHPLLRIINPKSFFYEIIPGSGGNGYPTPSLLAPGDQVRFEASTSDPSPLTIQVQMTQRSAWFMVLHMLITMLPGANQFGIQPSSVACITERLADVSDIASAVESLLNNNGLAAAASLQEFMANGDAVRRFITAADDCNFGPAPTWSVEGIKQLGGAVSTIMSATDYIANYFADNNYAQVSFNWIQTPQFPALFADQNYPCLRGPGSSYPSAHEILNGMSSQIIGRSSNGWYQIAISFADSPFTSCWIGGGIVSGDISSIPVDDVSSFPLPTLCVTSSFDYENIIQTSQTGAMDTRWIFKDCTTRELYEQRFVARGIVWCPSDQTDYNAGTCNIPLIQPDHGCYLLFDPILTPLDTVLQVTEIYGDNQTIYTISNGITSLSRWSRLNSCQECP